MCAGTHSDLYTQSGLVLERRPGGGALHKFENLMGLFFWGGVSGTKILRTSLDQL